MPSSLSIDVFNSGYKPIPADPPWPASTPATWPASTSTLIAGDNESVLVDALMTTGEGERLADWVRALGKEPEAIYVTHGHADHFFGAGPVLDAFPQADLLASDQQVIEEAQAQTTPQAMATWNAWFAGQLPAQPALPALATAGECQLDGHTVMFHTEGRADGALGTVVHVPEQATVCSGDIAYNDIHMWLRNSTPDSRAAWLASLDAIAALKPATIITGHRDPRAPDDSAVRILDQSRRYIEDFDAAVADAGRPEDVIGVMTARYPGFGNPYTLFVSAGSQFPP